MEDLEQLSMRIRKNPDDLDAWKAVLALVDDPKKKKDCQDQIDRINAKQQAPVICPQCGAGMTVYYAGELHDKRARCPYCRTDIDIPDAYSRTVVEKKAGFGQILPETDFTVYERRADNNGGTITSDEIDKLIMDKGLDAARKELAARGIKDLKISGFSGIDKSSEENRILEEEGAKALAKSKGAVIVTEKQGNMIIKGVLVFFAILSLGALILSLVHFFMK
jgi:isopentenyl diphosphate isomerase/L-lactate dehydrogenase-like FMN-dependent dehydrogenase